LKLFSKPGSLNHRLMGARVNGSHAGTNPVFDPQNWLRLPLDLLCWLIFYGRPME